MQHNVTWRAMRARGSRQVNIARLMLATLLLLPALGQAGNANYQVVALGAVPDKVRQAAISARPGSYVTRVVRQLERNDNLQYRFFASQVGRYWVIVVRDDGELVEVYESPNPPRSDRD